MKNLELLTIESYLDSQMELIENAGYMIEELYDQERFDEIIKEIKDVYFWKEKGQNRKPYFVYIIKKKNSYYYEYVSVSSRIFRVCPETTDDKNELSDDVIKIGEFRTWLKKKYHQLIREKKGLEIVDDIGFNISMLFVASCDLDACLASREYEIMKYTLTEQKQCDIFDNGKYMREMGEDDIYPFEIQNDCLPIYCQELQRVLFGVHRKIFDRNSLKAKDKAEEKPDDITRYGFYNTQKIYDEVTKALWKKKSKYYVEGDEDYILLDRIFGISLTNIIYWKTKGIEKRKVQDRIIKTVCLLAKCEYSIGRNLVAHMLLDFLEATEYNKEIMNMVEELLNKWVKIWNEYYEEIEAMSLCRRFNAYIKEGFIENDYIEICTEYEKYNSWKEYEYMDKIAKRKGMLNDNKIRITRSKDDNKTRISKESKDNKKTRKIRMNDQAWYACIHEAVFKAIWSV